MQLIRVNQIVRQNTKLKIVIVVLVFLNIALMLISRICYEPTKIVFFYSPHKYKESDISCYNKTVEGDLPRVDENYHFPEKSIFFVETSCKVGIDSRQACAVESAARNNPGWQVNLIFLGPIPLFVQAMAPLAQLFETTNIKLLRVHIKKFSKGTPLESLVSCKAIENSLWRVHHTSDIMRFLTLYKFSGVYLDTDIVVVKSFDSLPKNWVAKESREYVAAGALSFSNDSIGRIMANTAINIIKRNFNPYLWTNNGPGTIKRTLWKLCSTKHVAAMSATRCKGIEVYSNEYFYPVHYTGYDFYFDKPRELWPGVEYTHHMWNKLSHKAKIAKGSIYDQLANKYCPSVYRTFMSEFNFG